MSTATSPVATPAPRTPSVRIGGRDVPVLLPKRGDPRLKVAAILLTVQLLGQTVLDFKLSLIQILTCLGVAAVIEIAVVFRRDAVLAWPASALLTGNSVALLLRATGTRANDLFSTNGLGYFAAAVTLALLSKYLIRLDGHHVFNPSNVGLVWVLLVIGPTAVFPQPLWWGPFATPVILATGVLVLGGIWILRPLRMLGMVAAFLATLGAGAALLAIGGAEFAALWSGTPVGGLRYWTTIVLSPETLVFVLFMMSDPQTTPRSPRGRLRFGATTALVALALLSFQPTEFGVKLAVLSSLTVTCAAMPFIRRSEARAATEDTAPDVAPARPWHRPVLASVAIIALFAVVDTAVLAGDEHLLLLEQGRSGDPNPQ